MKKILSIISLLVLTITLAACGNSINDKEKLPQEAKDGMEHIIDLDLRVSNYLTAEDISFEIYQDKEQNKFIYETSEPYEDKNKEQHISNYFKEGTDDVGSGTTAEFDQAKKDGNYKLIYQSGIYTKK